MGWWCWSEIPTTNQRWLEKSPPPQIIELDPNYQFNLSQYNGWKSCFAFQIIRMCIVHCAFHIIINCALCLICFVCVFQLTELCIANNRIVYKLWHGVDSWSYILCYKYTNLNILIKKSQLFLKILFNVCHYYIL